MKSLAPVPRVLATLVLCVTITFGDKPLTNGTDGTSAPLPPMLQMAPRFGDPPDSSTNETETAALAFTSFSVSTNGVGFAMGWLPGLGLACLDLLYSERLDTNGWTVLDRWAVAPAQTNDTRFVAYGGSFTNAASGFFNLRGYTYAGDPDADGLSIAQELSLGTDPFAADTDGDGSSDGEELGTATVLTGEDFLWLDLPVSGPGRLVSASGFSVRVEPTQSSGTVVVEARFNDDAVQPTFVLPIVTPQTVPIRAFVVCSDDNEPAISDEDIAEQLRYANRAFAQVGISFDLVSIEHHVADSSYWDVTMNESWVDPWGVKQKKLSDQAVNLLNWYQERDCIEVYYVGGVSGGEDIAAAGGRSGIIMGQMAHPPTLAHELGHVFGLKDILLGCGGVV